MPDVDVLLRPEARAFYNQVATSTEQLRIKAIVNELCESPAADERRKYALGAGGVLYHDGAF